MGTSKEKAKRRWGELGLRGAREAKLARAHVLLEKWETLCSEQLEEIKRLKASNADLQERLEIAELAAQYRLETEGL